MSDEQTTPEWKANSESSGGSSEAEALREQLQQLQMERDKNLEHWQRSQAEMENLRKRAARELDQERQYRSLALARDLMPVLDNLRRATQASQGTADAGQLLQGVEIVLKQMEEALARHSIKPIPTVGQPFDPNLHEAVLQQPSADYPPMTVIQEVERGYTLHDRVIRPGKVIVSSAPAG